MVSTEPLTTETRPTQRMPTEYLLGRYTGDISQVMTYRLIAQGFDQKDVLEMLSISDLYLKNNIINRILDKSTRTLQRQSRNIHTTLLTKQQSAVAFQYAKILELAIGVFGNQTLAEEWLGRPCKFLEGDMPLDVIDNTFGFQTVEDYLRRIEHGVYQ